ncbi:hypothetical protein Golomagni_02935 [Golovinomyces magnicellulatus]|nr:hypothetical protein Golomagni_02935 [Golovinomyces magnicellulatus]
MIFLHAIIATSLATSCFAAATGSSSDIKRNLNEDDVILFSKDGRFKVVPRSQYDVHFNGVATATPEQHYGNFVNVEEKPTSQNIVKRHYIDKSCNEQSVFSVRPSEKYINWDVPMSSVVRAPANSSVSISVSSGYWIGNSLRVSSSKNFDDVKFLGVAYDKSWSTTFSAGYSYTIPKGKYGAIVSNPLTTKHSGYVDRGCIGSTTRTEYSFESYNSKEFAQMKWVDGIISLCLGDTYPLPKCMGNGTI